LIENIKFSSKIPNFCRKSQILIENIKFSSKIPNFCRKSQILVENQNFGDKPKFWSKMQILVENQNFGRKSKFRRQTQMLVENPIFSQKSKFWSKIPKSGTHFSTINLGIWYFSARQTYIHCVAQETRIIRKLFSFIYFVHQKWSKSANKVRE